MSECKWKSIETCRVCEKTPIKSDNLCSDCQHDIMNEEFCNVARNRRYHNFIGECMCKEVVSELSEAINTIEKKYIFDTTECGQALRVIFDYAKEKQDV